MVDARRPPAPGPTAQPTAEPTAEGAEPRESAGPPEDAATTFEDLPGDLFGEEDGGAAPPLGDRTPSSPPEPRQPAARPEGREPAPSTPPAKDAAGPAADPQAEDGDVLAAVGRLFPGRIIALEAAGEDGETDGDVPLEGAPTDEGMDDDAAAPDGEPGADGNRSLGTRPGPSADGRDDTNG